MYNQLSSIICLIEYKKENFGSANYTSFWGDFQYEILNCIPDSLLDEKSIQLKKVLNRKFSVWNYSIYDCYKKKDYYYFNCNYFYRLYVIQNTNRKKNI